MASPICIRACCWKILQLASENRNVLGVVARASKERNARNPANWHLSQQYDANGYA